MFTLLLPVVGLPPGFMQNNGSGSVGLMQPFTYRIRLHHHRGTQYCRVNMNTAHKSNRFGDKFVLSGIFVLI